MTPRYKSSWIQDNSLFLGQHGESDLWYGRSKVVPTGERVHQFFTIKANYEAEPLTFKSHAELLSFAQALYKLHS